MATMDPEFDYGGDYVEEEYEEEEYEEYEEEEYVEEEYVEEEPAAPPAAGGDMAAMIAAAANKRNNRIDAGGPVKITEVQEEERVIPQEHKNVFVSVASEAAGVGKLLRFGEHTVEAVADKKEEEKDIWSGPGGLRTDNTRSDFMKAIREAAAVGQVKGLKPVEVTNYDVNEYHDEEPELEDIDKKVDDKGRRVVRAEYLIDYQVEEARREKNKDWGGEDDDRPDVKSMDEVVLPAKKVPGFRKKEPKLTQKQSMDAIAAAVAERAWERNFRLNRPKAALRVTRKCACKYCYNPNPFQTHKYKELHEEGIEIAEDVQVMEEPKKKKWEPPQKTAPTPSFKPNVLPSAKAEAKPGEWKQAIKERPKTPPPRKAAPPPVPESEPEQQEYEEDFNDGPVVLLDETITFGSKKPKPKKDKKDKKKKKSKKKSKKGGKDDGCSIM